MRVIQNEWSHALRGLQNKLGEMGRRVLLSRMIGTFQDITQSNFGDDGQHRPMPWPMLDEDYAHEWKYGDTTPTLMMSDEMHSLRNSDVPHLIDCFEVNLTSRQASITNLSEYADAHQFGYGIPARPYYPIDEAGNPTPYAEAELTKVAMAYFAEPLQ